MKMNLDFAGYIDEIEFEPFLGKNEKAYQAAFDSWYYETCEQDFDGQKIVAFAPRKDLQEQTLDSNIVIKWIKEVAPQANPKIVRINLSRKSYNKKLPMMCF